MKKKQHEFSKAIDRIFNSRHRTLWLALIIFLCWLPVLIMLFPGTLANDTWGQLNQVMNLKDGAWTISAHHPVFDTSFMSIIILPAAHIFNNWQLAFFVYVLIQAIFTSLVFAYSISYFKDKFKQNNRTSFIFLLIFCFFPVFVMSVQNISKDALFSWLYVLFTIQFIEILRTKGEALKRMQFLGAFLLVCILCILAKKAAVYVILVSLVVVLLFQKGNRARLLIPISVLAIFNFAFLPAVRYTFNIEPSGTQEMLSVPFQQTARFVKEHESEVTTEEKEIIGKVLEYEKLPVLYDPTDADPVKGYEPRGEKNDYKEYLKVWIAQGLRHPETYLAATADHLSGWFSFNLYQPSISMAHHSQQNDYYIPESATERPAVFNTTADIVDNIYKFIYHIPLIGVIFTFAFFATIIPYSFVIIFFKYRKANGCKYLLVIVPLLLSLFIGCYLAPVSANLEGARYLFPIVYSTPTLAMLATSLYHSSKVRKVQNSDGAS
ncbi:MAG: DUF6020 family protein [Candidatus Saccharibacteria bacterium]|nr:DUF6020 family protein [Candidatus Saccharibacteria bacterium]